MIWYVYQMAAGSCGWEVVFVSAVEATYYMIDITVGSFPPGEELLLGLFRGTNSPT